MNDDLLYEYNELFQLVIYQMLTNMHIKSNNIWIVYNNYMLDNHEINQDHRYQRNNSNKNIYYIVNVWINNE